VYYTHTNHLQIEALASEKKCPKSTHPSKYYQNVLWGYWVSGNNYKVAMLGKLYLIIIMQRFKSIGQF
jgi:hypothetical protein